MKDSARYVKIVEWSDEDQCYVGSAPGFVYGGCHGLDERAVFAELCEIDDDAPVAAKVRFAIAHKQTAARPRIQREAALLDNIELIISPEMINSLSCQRARERWNPCPRP